MSKTAIGGIISIFVLVCQMFGVVFPEGTETNLTEGIATLVGVVLLVWGQLSRSDLKFGIMRK